MIRYIGPPEYLWSTWVYHEINTQICESFVQVYVSVAKDALRLSDSEDKCNPIYVFLHRRVVQAPKVVLLIIMKIWRLCTIREDSEVFQMLNPLVHIQLCQIYLQSSSGGQTLGWLWWSFEIAMGNIDPQSSMIF